MLEFCLHIHTLVGGFELACWLGWNFDLIFNRYYHVGQGFAISFTDKTEICLFFVKGHCKHDGKFLN